MRNLCRVGVHRIYDDLHLGYLATCQAARKVNRDYEDKIELQVIHRGFRFFNAGILLGHCEVQVFAEGVDEIAALRQTFVYNGHPEVPDFGIDSVSENDQQLRRNRGLLIQLLIPPTIVLVIFGYAMNPKVRDLRMAVIDESLTPQSRDFINALSKNVNFTVAEQYTRIEEAEAAMNHLKLDLILVIPVDFARSLARGQIAKVQVVIDAVDANTAQIAQGYLQMAAANYNASGGADPRGAIAPVQVRSAYLYNPGLETGGSTSPGS